jgi:hypothetical protein
MEKTTILVLMFIFALLSLISLIGVYFAHQLPTEEEKIIPLCTYEHRGEYDYTARLKPNNLYNKTVLKTGEGVLYTKITELVNVTFTYTFNSSLPANITLLYSFNMNLESSRWPKRTLSAAPPKILNFTKESTAQLQIAQSINVTELDMLKNAIDKETGTYTSEYSLVLEPIINVIAKTVVGEINEPFTPVMNMSLRYGTPEGDYIAIEGLTQARQGYIARKEVTYHPEVAIQRYTSYALSTAFVAFLLITVLAYVRVKPKKTAAPEKAIEEIIAPYEETIFRIDEEPSYGKNLVTTVKLRSLQELISIGDGLAKPVLYLKKVSSKPGEKATHVFYVLDGSVIYEYEVTELEKGESAGEKVE